MKLLKSWAALALLGTAAPALAQEAFLRIDPGATRHVLSEGTVTTPSSSLPMAQAGTAHTNVNVFQPAGAPANTSPNARPEVTPFPGLFIETPQSIACVYRFVTAVPGCNPDKVTATLKGGSRTIIIVDAFHAPNALSDLQTFSMQFGLPVPMMPNGPSFQVVYADPSGAVTGTPPLYNPGWEIEISLDIQWAHAMAPNANILLVEAASNLNAHLAAAVVLANTLVTGGGELSMSWGSPEFSTETSVDPIFMSPGIVYFASTGDSPGTSWPSVSANVVAVGGTTISRDPATGDLVGEAAWGDGGGGPSEFVQKPGYQASVKKLAKLNSRGVPDVAAVANPRTGVWAYVSNAHGWNGTPWLIVGGTSVSSPVVAGLVNTVGRFNGSSAAELAQYYAPKTSSFTDIVEGICGPNVGYWTATGWDFCTGLGSPVKRQ
jgi:subtilase family serine protease